MCSVNLVWSTTVLEHQLIFLLCLTCNSTEIQYHKNYCLRLNMKSTVLYVTYFIKYTSQHEILMPEGSKSHKKQKWAKKKKLKCSIYWVYWIFYLMLCCLGGYSYFKCPSICISLSVNGESRHTSNKRRLPVAMAVKWPCEQ